MLDRLRQQLAEREAQHTRRRLRISMGPCQPQLQVARAELQGGDELAPQASETKALLAFCSNDYLGLANHPELINAWAEGARLYGVGSGASHLISGHSAAHAQLESELGHMQAPFIPGARALYFSTGYMANLAVLTALGSSDATLFCDKLNHASLIDGALLAAAKVQRYPNADMERLAYQLQQCTTPLKLIVTDAVFSMDGSVAPLRELLRLAEAHDAWVVVDDAHGFGVLGERGQGSLAYCGVGGERFIYMGTLGKAAGVAGAFVAAHPVIIEWLINAGRSYIYTTASSPAQAHALLTSLHLIQSEEGAERRAHLGALIQRLRSSPDSAWAQRGWRWAESITAIQPLMVGDNPVSCQGSNAACSLALKPDGVVASRRHSPSYDSSSRLASGLDGGAIKRHLSPDTTLAALSLSAQLEQQGLWVPAIRPPTVPIGTARLRITLSASHTAADVDQLLAALANAARGAM